MRSGRLNTVELLPDRAIKTCEVREAVRPRKLFVECWALKQARSEGVATPRVIAYRNTPTEVLELERVPGNSLKYGITETSVRAYEQIGLQLSGLRRDHVGYGWIDPETLCGVYTSWRQFLYDFSKRYCEQLSRQELLSAKMCDQLLDGIVSYEGIDKSPSALVHRDIKPGNIIWGESGAFLIDWENVILGDPWFDMCLYKCRFGGGHHWRALTSSVQEIDDKKEALYLAIALIGLIDFCVTFGYGIRQKHKRLCALLQRM